MTPEAKKKLRRKTLLAAALGALLGLVCNLLPPEYQVGCKTVLKICTGGL